MKCSLVSCMLAGKVRRLERPSSDCHQPWKPNRYAVGARCGNVLCPSHPAEVSIPFHLSQSNALHDIDRTAVCNIHQIYYHCPAFISAGSFSLFARVLQKMLHMSQLRKGFLLPHVLRESSNPVQIGAYVAFVVRHGFHGKATEREGQGSACTTHVSASVMQSDVFFCLLHLGYWSASVYTKYRLLLDLSRPTVARADTLHGIGVHLTQTICPSSAQRCGHVCRVCAV